MFSKRFYRLIELLVPVLACLGGLSYSWDARTRQFYPLNKQSCNNRKILISHAYMFLWFIFAFFQIFRYSVSQNYNYVLYLVTMTFVLCCVFIIYTIIVVEAEDFFSMANGIITYLEWMKRKYLNNGITVYDLQQITKCLLFLGTYLPAHIPEESKRIKIFDFLLVLLIIGSTLVFLCISAFFILFPDFPNLFGSIFPNCGPWVILCSGVHLYSVFLYVFQVLFVLVCAAAYGIILIPVVTHEFRVGRKSYASISSLREPVNLTIAYRSSQVFHNQLNKCLGYILFPAQTMATLLFIFSSYMIIRMRADMEILQICVLSALSVISFSAWSIVLVIFGHVNFGGNKVLASWKKADWKSRWEKKFMNKFRVSCRPITICWGKYFVVRPVSLLVYLRGLTRGLVRTLLALDERMKG